MRSQLCCAVLVLAGALGVSGANDKPLKVPVLGTDSEPEDLTPVRISTAWSADGVAPGGQVWLAIVMDIKDGWHVQTNRPEWEFAVPTTLKPMDLPGGVLLGDIRWPIAQPIKVKFFEDKPLNFFSGRAPIFIRVSVGPAVKPGEYPLKLELTTQACDDQVCLRPETTQPPIILKVVGPSTPVHPSDTELFAGVETGRPGERLNFNLFGLGFAIDPRNLLLLLPIAALGGFLLNLTPCVLPLVPIKIMSLSAAAANRQRCFLLGLVMSLGVVAFWMGLGIAVASVSGFTSANQLFQYPWFTIAVGVVIAIMALGMGGGLFAVRLPQRIYGFNPRHDTIIGSFAFGIMTAVLSTPCTAPFMGTAASWAVTTDSSILILSTFAAIGTGMALPYILLSAFPALVDHVPRTGPASELVKQVMGLLMLAAAAYFIGAGLAGLLVTPPDPPTLLYWWAVGAFIAAAGLWLAWRTIRISRSTGKRVAFAALGLILAAGGIWMGVRLTDEGPIDWVYYSPQRLADARAQKKIVVTDFTAQWCVNCQTLERLVLHDRTIVELLRRADVVPLRVDLTGNNVEGNALLKQSGRLFIPLLTIHDADGHEVFKSDNYTVDQVAQAINRASGSTQASVTGHP